MNMLIEFWPLTISLVLGITTITIGIWLLLRNAEKKMISISEVDHRVSRRSLWVLTAWAIAAFLLSWIGFFQAKEESVFPFIALGIVFPFMIGFLFMQHSKKLVQVLSHISQPWLIALQFYRSLGFLFLVLYFTGKIPGVCALPAGIGDMLVGVTAPIVAYVYAKGYKNSCLAVLAWNVLGIIDLSLAITLGFISSPGMFQLLAIGDANEMITAFPLVLIPTFAVPLSILLHLVSLRILRAQVKNGHKVKGGTPMFGCTRLSGCEV